MWPMRSRLTKWLVRGFSKRVPTFHNAHRFVKWWYGEVAARRELHYDLRRIDMAQILFWQSTLRSFVFLSVKKPRSLVRQSWITCRAQRSLIYFKSNDWLQTILAILNKLCTIFNPLHRSFLRHSPRRCGKHVEEREFDDEGRASAFIQMGKTILTTKPSA